MRGSKSLFTFLAGCLFLASCGNEPKPEFRRHLFALPPSALELPKIYLPETLTSELSQGFVWIRNESRVDADWRVHASRLTADDGPMHVRTFTDLPVYGPPRLVDWRKANIPDEGTLVLGDTQVDSLDIESSQVLVTGSGIMTVTPRTGTYPPPRPYSYPTPTQDILSNRIGTLPNMDSVISNERLHLAPVSRRVMLAPSPARISWRTMIPENTGLRFGVGLRAISIERCHDELGGVEILAEDLIETNTNEAVLYGVSLRTEDTPEQILLETTLELDQAGKFVDQEIDLAAWAGQFVEITFWTKREADAPDLRFMPFFSEPLLDSPDPTRPNVILLVVDTLRADGLGCYGNPRAVSPNIDALAARGVRYEDVMSSATWTLPAHVSLLSSLYPTEHGVQHKEKVPAELKSLTKVFRAADYETQAITEGIFITPRYGFDQGFDHFQVSNWNVTQTFNAALGSLSAVKGPFFLYLHTYQPHAPFVSNSTMREKWVAPYDGPLNLPITNNAWNRIGRPLDEADLRFIHEVYDAEIAWVDAEVGRLVALLEQRGLRDSTVILLTSDHGESLYEREVWGHGTSAYQEQLRVPLILVDPRNSQGGQVVSHTVHAVDVAPTLAHAANIPVPEEWSGVLLGLTPSSNSRPLFSGFLAQPWQREATVLRQGPYKIIRFPAESKNRGNVQIDTMLFNLDEDPGELNNLWVPPDENGANPFGIDPEIYGDISVLRARWGARFSMENTQQDNEFSTELEQLGYGGGREGPSIETVRRK
jgi:arylsulfatase A-like enzyme